MMTLAAPELFHAVAENAVERVEDLKAHQPSNIVMSFAMMDHAAQELIGAFAKNTVEGAQDISHDKSRKRFLSAGIDHGTIELFDVLAKKAVDVGKISIHTLFGFRKHEPCGGELLYALIENL